MREADFCEDFDRQDHYFGQWGEWHCRQRENKGQREAIDATNKVKAKARDEEGIPLGHKRLIFAREQIEVVRTLSDDNIQEEIALHLAWRLC